MAISLLISANGLTAAIDSIAKHLSDGLPSVQIVWGYYVGISVSLLVCAALRSLPWRDVVTTSRLPAQLTRSTMLAFSLVTLFVGIAHLPIADVVAITFMAPLFITLLAVPMLGETFRLYRFGAVAAGLLGVFIIVRPGFVSLHWAVSMPIISAVFWALFQILTRRLASTERTATTLFYTTLGGVFWASIAVLFVWRPMSVTDVLFLSGAGVLGAAAHYLLTRAFAQAEASLLAPFNYVKLVWVAILGFVVFGEQPSTYTLLGSLVIVMSGVFVFIRQRQLATVETQPRGES